jgi:hypothetical protein
LVGAAHPVQKLISIAVPIDESTAQKSKSLARWRNPIAPTGWNFGSEISYRNLVEISIVGGCYRNRLRLDLGSFSVASRHFKRPKWSSAVPFAARAPLLAASPPRLLSLPCPPARHPVVPLATLSSCSPRRRPAHHAVVLIATLLSLSPPCRPARHPVVPLIALSSRSVRAVRLDAPP